MQERHERERLEKEAQEAELRRLEDEKWGINCVLCSVMQTE